MNKKQMIEEAVGRICHVQEMTEAYLAARSYLQRKDRDWKDDSKMYHDLMNAELEEWRGLLLWGLVADNDTRDRLKAMARERFLSDKHCVAKWFHNGEMPSRWLEADEKEFRNMIKEAFSPSK